MAAWRARLGSQSVSKHREAQHRPSHRLRASGRGVPTHRLSAVRLWRIRSASRGTGGSDRCMDARRASFKAAQNCAPRRRLGDRPTRTIRHRQTRGVAMARITTNGALLALAVAFTAPVTAQSIVSAESPGELASIIQKLGFQAKLEK